MALGHAWSVDLPDRRHRVEVRHGYWSGKVEVDVDGKAVHRSRPLVSFGLNRGIDVPFDVDGHALVVQIRLPERSFGVKGSDYTFGLTVDGEPMAGDPPMRELPKSAGTTAAVEMVAWASAGGVIVGLSRSFDSLALPLAYLIAPVVVSWLARNAKLSRGRLWLVSIAILPAWIVVLAVVGVALEG